jgi:hypothetical protein
VQQGRVSQEQADEMVAKVQEQNEATRNQITNLKIIRFQATPGSNLFIDADFEFDNETTMTEIVRGRVGNVMRKVWAYANELDEILGTSDLDTPGLSMEWFKSRAAMLRLFIHYLAYWHQEQDPGSEAKKHSRQNEEERYRKGTRAYVLPPGYKVFRDYHYITSRSDIMENRISATLREMHNSVTIRRPKGTIKYWINGEEEFVPPDPTETPTEQHPITFSHSQNWESFPINEGLPIHPRIAREHRKLLVQVENNAVDETQAARCLISSMADAVRPMYRGHITIVGRNLKPYDVLNIHDEYNEMIGPVEVDEVVHHFTPQTGWITNVTPCTLAVANDQPSRVQLNGWQWYLNRGLTFLNEYWLPIEVGMFLISGGYLNVAVRGARGAAATVGKKMLGALGETVVKQTGVNWVRQKLGRAILKFGANSTQAKAAAATHVTSLLRTIGRGAPIAGFKLLGRANYVAAPLFLSSTWLRIDNGSRQIPVDIAVLMLKGRPYTAGLEFSADSFLSFSDRWTGFWSEMFGVTESAVFDPDFAILDRGA